MSGGRLIAVVGPSGAGKDSLIAGLADADPGLRPVRRVITRPTQVGGEPFEGVDETEFDARQAAGAFCLSWQAHGLSYGIPAEALASVEAGEARLVNLSRRVLPKADAVFPSLVVLNVTASPQTLAARLARRGRETKDDIARRLSRQVEPFATGLIVHTIPNDGALQDAIKTALGALRLVRA
ncbi:MAG: phosphonate metabolism protein/1,5-bisphosphokinase (PRPP-forming) PhnN [Pseudomonadota bacterium]